VPLFVVLREASPKWVWLLGWWAETLINEAGFYWLIGTMVRFGFTAVPLRMGRYALLLSTDVALSAQAIYRYGKARFQVSGMGRRAQPTHGPGISTPV
jgi:hypothetical protein